MISLNEIKSILANQNPADIEQMAQKANALTQKNFGRTISLYAPLYISNYCSSHCTYCGFHSHHRIKRFKLSPAQMHQEMSFLANEGVENILILTGESYDVTPLSYLMDAVDVAKGFFPSISLEVHPMGQNEYGKLFAQGVDGVTVYQETYDRKRYAQVHLSGTKSEYDFRYGTPERAAQGGIRSISMGILLGLADIAEDIHSLYSHLTYMERNYPGIEYSLSFPRLQTIKGQDFDGSSVDDVTFIKVICLSRLLFPRVGINLSTREHPRLRNRALEFGITRMSAGSNTAVGGYTLKLPEEQDPQFDIEDHRTVADIMALLKDRHFDPVLTDWRRIENRIN